MTGPQSRCFFCEESRATLAEARRVYTRLQLDPSASAAALERVRVRVAEMELALRRHSCDQPPVRRSAPARLGAVAEAQARESA